MELQTPDVIDSEYTGVYAAMKLRALENSIEEATRNISILQGSLVSLHAAVSGYTNMINLAKSHRDTVGDPDVDVLREAKYISVVTIAAFENEVISQQEKLEVMLLERAKYNQ